jgi:hypothetical protein
MERVRARVVDQTRQGFLIVECAGWLLSEPTALRNFIGASLRRLRGVEAFAPVPPVGL